MNNLQELLNKLIEKWWKPRGFEEIGTDSAIRDLYITHREDSDILLVYVNKEVKCYSLNDLCSIDSWLLQWVYGEECTPMVDVYDITHKTSNELWKLEAMEYSILSEQEKIDKLIKDLTNKLSNDWLPPPRPK